jgi:hypothetical protein
VEKMGLKYSKTPKSAEPQKLLIKPIKSILYKGLSNIYV